MKKGAMFVGLLVLFVSVLSAVTDAMALPFTVILVGIGIMGTLVVMRKIRTK